MKHIMIAFGIVYLMAGIIYRNFMEFGTEYMVGAIEALF